MVIVPLVSSPDMPDHDRAPPDDPRTSHGERSIDAADAAAELPMLDVYMAMMKASAIISAGQLGLFAALADGPQDARALAGTLAVSESGIRSLCEFLVDISYLERHGELFANTAWTTRWFSKSGTVDYTSGLLWSAQAWTLMGGLTDAVRHGRAPVSLWDRMNDRKELGATFSAYMHAFACHLTTDLVDRVALPPGARRLLDLGGSHGLHSVAFCERHPELEAVVADLASALTYTEDLIAEKRLSDRISLLPGDLRESDWGSGYDVVFYLSVAHNQTPRQNREIIGRIADVLNPGGILVVHEYLADDALAFYNAFQLTLLVETSTRIYSFAEIASWLDEAGFATPPRMDLNPREKGTILVAKLR